MNILLINPLVREWAQPNCFPLGLGYIASILRDDGHNINVLDLNADRDIKIDQSFSSNTVELIGITGIITQYAEVKKIAKECKEVWPNASIVCGGPLASSIGPLLLEKTEVDYCIDGEGENIISDMCREIDSVNNFFKDYGPGLYKASDIITDLDTIPYPAYDFFPMKTYLNNPIAAQNTNKWIDGKSNEIEKSMNMCGTRGCMFNCIYCFHNFLGQGYRMRDPKKIVDEMVWLWHEYGVKYIHFTDDAFACSKKFIKAFCKEINKREEELDFEWNLQWSCAGRANMVNDEIIQIMAESGCQGLCYGLESGSQKILDRINKKVSLKQYREAIALNQKYFSYQDYTFIVGSPEETDETIQESIDFCKEMGMVPTAVFYMTPYPGTPLFAELKETNKDFKNMVENPDTFEQFILSLGEQGEQIVWNCSGQPDEKVYEWHQRFLEETGAWNKEVH